MAATQCATRCLCKGRFMLELKFDGVAYTYWQKVVLHSSVDDLCASLELALARPLEDRPSNFDAFGAVTGTTAQYALPMTPNTVATVMAAGQQVCVVRPDSLSRQVSATEVAVAIKARSLGRELVDCQYSATLDGLHLTELCKRICSLFKVPLRIDASVGKGALVEHFAMQCELPANALINAVRSANLLLYPEADGGLVLTTPSDAPAVATLHYGQHFTAYALVNEWRLRFSEYRVKSFDYASDTAQFGASKDEGLNYFRPMHMVADKAGGGVGGCQRRAELELARRKARAYRLELTVPGWRHAEGAWALNTQLRVVLPPEQIDDVFLLGEMTFSLDDKGGEEAHLVLMPRAAFVNEPKKKAKRAAGVAAGSGKK
jgi:prophage tail gpP-like protein